MPIGSVFFYADEKKIRGAAACHQAARVYPGVQAPDMASADYVVVFGGDGSMLEALDKVAAFQRTAGDKKPPMIVGLNYGTKGILMNPQNADWQQLTQTARSVTFHPLEAVITDVRGHVHHQTAFNDIVVRNNSLHNQACSLDVQIQSAGQKDERGTVFGDGLIVATPAGSTGYYRNAGGIPFPIDTGRIGVQPICDVDARSLAKDIPDNCEIVVQAKDVEKRPVCVHADNHGAIENVASCRIKVNKRIGIPVLLGPLNPIMQRSYSR